MWTRAELKFRAKQVLKISYWKAFLVSLIIAIVGGNSSAPSFSWGLGNDRATGSDINQYVNDPKFLYVLGAIFLIAVIVFFVVIAYRIFLGYSLEVGGRRYFVRSAMGEENLNYLGFAFEKGRYFDIIKAMLWRALFTFLWSLLFIIPGIIKAYAYRMVPYILSDNPNIGYKRAIEISKKMTYGHKFAMWVLDLSFIGWYLLGTLAFLIGTWFVMPYENATKAELYLVLRKNAFDDGLCTREELLQDS
ncbi:MAG: DUF975 family protein [Clostridiales bacterium]|nr:DUF975 family protein [Clostridiales bacterium]